MEISHIFLETCTGNFVTRCINICYYTVSVKKLLTGPFYTPPIYWLPVDAPQMFFKPSTLSIILKSNFLGKCARVPDSRECSVVFYLRFRGLEFSRANRGGGVMILYNQQSPYYTIIAKGFPLPKQKSHKYHYLYEI